MILYNHHDHDEHPDNGGNTIVVSENSWDAHHDHGDYRGPCLNNSSRSFTINI
ncbi:hypothetical protein IBE76_10000 [Francisella tularensis]|uniref:hypothetical protein n=1 Tax=Francisella tularensis TaxID=263 RepID=UPI001C0EEC41|nr:hypothetical protein [Francisella tularensis]MBK2242310.1 hypothetical protein [Francisella tularensis]